MFAANSNQAVIVVAVLVTAFLVCWTPYLVWRMLILPPGIEVVVVVVLLLLLKPTVIVRAVTAENMKLI